VCVALKPAANRSDRRGPGAGAMLDPGGETRWPRWDESLGSNPFRGVYRPHRPSLGRGGRRRSPRRSSGREPSTGRERRIATANTISYIRNVLIGFGGVTVPNNASLPTMLGPGRHRKIQVPSGGRSSPRRVSGRTACLGGSRHLGFGCIPTPWFQPSIVSSTARSRANRI
jgi:hypothetical protein